MQHSPFWYPGAEGEFFAENFTTRTMFCAIFLFWNRKTEKCKIFSEKNCCFSIIGIDKRAEKGL